MEMRTHRHNCADLGTYLDPEMVHIWIQKWYIFGLGTYLDPKIVSNENSPT